MTPGEAGWHSGGMASPPRLTLSLLPGEYAVARLEPGAPPPGWAQDGELWAVVAAPGELSVVTLAGHVPDGTPAERGWAALQLHGPFAFGLTGILASVLNPLRDAGVGIFALSTFTTDYVLVQRRQLEAAVKALRQAGHTVMQA